MILTVIFVKVLLLFKAEVFVFLVMFMTHFELAFEICYTIKVLIIVKLWNYMFCLSAAKQEVIAKLQINSYASINAANC